MRSGEEQSPAVLRITNLRVRTIIGVNEWERDTEQEIMVNLSAQFDARRAVESDSIRETVNYKKIKAAIIEEVENSRFQLLESLTHRILELVLAVEGIQSATVRVDKPGALRFADSVSIEMSGKRQL